MLDYVFMWPQSLDNNTRKGNAYSAHDDVAMQSEFVALASDETLEVCYTELEVFLDKMVR